MNRSRPALALMGLLVLLLAPVRGQDEAERAAEGLVVGLARATAAEAWTTADRLVALGARVEPVVSKGLESSSPLVRFGCARALLMLTESEAAIAGLIQLLRPDQDPELLDLVIELMAREELEDAAVSLEALLAEPLPGELRANVARALFRCSPERQVRSVDVLRELLASGSADTRSAAALRLAEIGRSETARDVLESMAKEPTPTGRLARAHLDLAFFRRLVAQSDRGATVPPTDGKNLLTEVVRMVRESHQTGDRYSEDELEEAAAKGLLESIDPHSTFLNSDALDDWNFDLDPTYGGIGAYVDLDEAGWMFIVRPIYSGPAYEHRLETGDRIVEVDGFETRGHPLDEIIRRLKGPEGTKTTIKVHRRGWNEPRSFHIERAIIRIPTVDSELLPGGLGHVRLTTFGERTGAELEEALTRLEAEGMSALILDLRSNGGGYLDAAQDVAGKFLDGEREIVSWEGRNPRIAPRQVLRSTQPERVRKLPLIVLVDRFSASASEIVAGALTDHGRAKVLGERTFGKGSVQRLFPVPGFPGEPFSDRNGNGRLDAGEPFEDRNGNGKRDAGPRIKLTIARYTLPSGRSIHKERDRTGKVVHPGGLEPDEVLARREPLGYRVEELTRIHESRLVEDYVRKLSESNPETLIALAVDDGGSSDRYPDFPQLLMELDSKLPEDDIRTFVRSEVRRRAADLRGREFVSDYQTDPFLQRAIFHALAALGRPLESVEAYKCFRDRVPQPLQKEQPDRR